MTKRAKIGGEIGANGEWYEGGKFINTIPENRKNEGSSPKKVRKVQIEPGVWVADERRPIFSLVGTVVQYIDRDNAAKGITPFAAGAAYYGMPIAEVQALCDRYNAGERWM